MFNGAVVTTQTLRINSERYFINAVTKSLTLSLCSKLSIKTLLLRGILENNEGYFGLCGALLVVFFLLKGVLCVYL